MDTSESIDDDDIVKVYAEICNALVQFGGRLEGFVGFFDTDMYPPIRFSSAEDLASIRPKGGGGTDFGCVFDYVRENMFDDPPVSIVIFTDGHADFPDESIVPNIPVLWLISDKTVSAPWGMSAYVR